MRRVPPEGSPAIGGALDREVARAAVDEELAAAPLAVETSWARRAFASLSNRDYRWFWIGMAVSSVGTWARTAAQGWLVWRMTHSEAWLAWVSAATLLPIALVSLPAGALADRLDKRRLLVALQWGMCALSGALAALVAAGLATPTLLVVFAAALGVLRGVEMPSRQAYIVEIVGKGTLRNAVALNSIMFNLPLILGPALAGEVIRRFGVTPVFVLDAVSYAAPILAFARIRAVSRVGARGAESDLERLLAGVRFVAGHPAARALLGLLAVAMFFGWSYTSLLPAYADLLVPNDAALYGRLYSSSGVGAVLGALWIAGRRPAHAGRTIVAVLTGFALSLLAMALWPSVALAFTARAVAGFCMIAFFATANSTIQLAVPDELRGRVMALWTFCFALALPLGQWTMGLVAEKTRVTTSFAVGAGAILLAALAAAAAGRLARSRLQRSRATT